MKNKFYVLFLLCLFIAGRAVSQTTIFAAPNGSASSSGSSASSPTTFTNAIALVTAGGTISLATGTYSLSATVLIQGKNGTSSSPINVFAASGATPVLNFSVQATADANRGIVLDANFWHFRGITIEVAGDNGMLLSGNNNTIEHCIFRQNRDTGLQVSRFSSSATTISQWPSNNLILNCESFDNFQGPGDENSDGFAAKLTCGQGNVFDGCISHNNIDDGWDLFTKTDTGPIGIVTILNCVSYSNGTLTNGTTNANGDRNGFKLGGDGIPVNHIVRRCVAFNNGHHGFTDNNNLGSIEMSNNTSYNNVQSNFNFRTGGTHVFRNNLSFNAGSSDKATGTDVSSSNVWWMNNVSTNAKGLVVSSADFVSLTPSVSRNSDNSVNLGNFLALATGSDMINAGVTAPGITFNGSAPDIGARESGSTTPPTNFTLTASASPTTGGTVTLNPSGGTYASGTVVTITAAAASGNTFTSWSGDASGTSATTTVTMNANKSVVANFTVASTNPTATLTATAGNAQVVLTWTVTGTITGQQIFRDTDSNPTGRVLLTTPASTARTFTDNTAVNGTTYFYWVRLNGTTDSNAATATPQASGGTTTIRIEDTATSATGLCSFDGSISSNTGADNGQVINLTNSSGKGITWRVSTPAAGTYTLTWRYKNSGSQAATSAKLVVNGTTVNSALAFPKTSSSTTFTTTTASVSLLSGGNTIRVETTVSSEFADIDWIQITGNSPVASSCPAGAREASDPTTLQEQLTLGLSVYPNPNHGLVTLEFVLPQEGKVSIRVMDSLGKSVAESTSENYPAGHHQVGFDLSNSKSGLYICHLHYGASVIKKKIMIEK